MEETTTSHTKKRIFQIATAEFLQKGFRGASLRAIVKNAGVTTGAFYGYFKNKEEIFDAIVSPHATELIKIFQKYINEFLALPKTEWKTDNSRFAHEGMREMYDYAEKNKTAFQLILTAAAGTRWEHYLHDIVQQEIDITHRFYAVLEAEGLKPRALNPTLEHSIISGEFSALFELIVHDIPREEGLKCVEDIYSFYNAGWNFMLNS